MQLRTLPAALLVTGTLLTFVPAGPLAAQTAVTVDNPSFETPALSDGGFSTGLTNWITLGNTGIGLTTDIGTRNPTNTQYNGTTGSGSAPGMQGSQIASFRTQALTLNLATLGGSANQSTGPLLSLATTYRLTVAVGFPKDVNIFQGYTISLFSAGTSLPTTVLASVNQTTGGVPAQGTFQDVSLEYELVPGLSGLANASLFVGLSVPGGVSLLGNITGVGQSSGTDFDNVRLTATPIGVVPEPSTVASACVGLLGLAAVQYARRRRGFGAPLRA